MATSRNFNRLLPSIGLASAIAVAIGTTIGSGIFRVPPTLASQILDLMIALLGGLAARRDDGSRKYRPACSRRSDRHRRQTRWIGGNNLSVIR